MKEDGHDMNEAELGLLRREFPDLDWQTDPQPHRYRAHDGRWWMLAKFSGCGTAWAAGCLTDEFLSDAEDAEEFATWELDGFLKQILAGGPVDLGKACGGTIEPPEQTHP